MVNTLSVFIVLTELYHIIMKSSIEFSFCAVRRKKNTDESSFMTGSKQYVIVKPPKEGGTVMKFHLIIDKNAEEEIQATVRRESELTEQLENIVLQYNGMDKIPAYTEDTMKLLPFSEIECISVFSGKSYAIDRSGHKYRLKYRLCELDNMLPQNFTRINKSALANKDRIAHLAVSFNGSVDAVFKCGYRDYISRRCLADLKRRLGIK